MEKVRHLVKADFHNHIRTASDIYEGDFNRIVDAAAKSLGADGVLGVVDFADDRYKRLVESSGYGRYNLGTEKNGIYVGEKKIIIVRGEEIATREGHLLVIGLGYNAHSTQGRTLEDSIKEARDNDGVIIANHPFTSRYGTGEYLRRHPELLADIDAVEIHNGEAALGLPFGPIKWGANQRARQFYEEMKKGFPYLGALSASDGHSIDCIGSSWTEIECPNVGDREEFLPSLRKSVNFTDSKALRQSRNSVMSAMAHIWDLAFIEKKSFG